MLIRFNRGCWLNLELDDIKSIIVAHTTILGRDEVRFTVSVEMYDDSEVSDFFDTFADAEKFAQDIVDKLNSEARHEKS